MSLNMDSRNYGYHETNNLFCHPTRRKTRCLSAITCVVLCMWLLVIFLLKVTENPASSASTNKVKTTRNVFEGFNAHRIIFRGLNSKEEDYVTVPGNNAFQEMSYKTRLPVRNKSVLSTLDNLYLDHDPLLPSVDCLNVLRGDDNALQESKLRYLEFNSKSYEVQREKLANIDEKLINMTEDCRSFLMERKYVTAPLTAEERGFPIAYVITIHRKFSMFERLLRSIYHPQNVYCIHVDRKSPSAFIDAIRKFARCFDNVFVASQLVEVHYSHWSRVQADLNCFSDLVARKHQVPWKYVINLCGQDFPLKTNLEMVRSLKSLHGFNNMETVTAPSHKLTRFKHHYILPRDPKNEYAIMERTDTMKTPSPLDTPMFVGSAYYILKRQAVEFFLSDETVQSFFNWSEDAFSPDEHVWATLQRWYPRVPGSHPPHEKYDQNELQSITRLVKWGGLDGSVYPKCAGRYSRGVCIYGLGDLSWLLQQHHLFANKFAYDVDPYAVDCLDVWLRNRTITQAKRYISMGYL